MHGFKKSGLPLILVAAFAWSSAVPLYAEGPLGESTKDPLLDTINNEFRVQYRQALAAALAQVGPVILEEGDDLILIHKGERASVPVKPLEYHELKAIAHIPLALFVMLSFPQEAHLSAGRRTNLRRYRELMEKARATLPGRHFTPEQLSRQQKIFSASFELLDDIFAKSEVKPQKLASFARQIGPLLLANVADAAAVELRELYTTAASWREQLSPSEWDALHVVMIGPHMPREQEISIQFFERVFHEPAEGRRIIYAEALWKEPDALNLLATHIVDEAAGEVFFGEPMRMHRDLLADAAKTYLDAHPLVP